jgi:hypothetical protein
MTDDELLALQALLETVDLDALAKLTTAIADAVPVILAELQRDARRVANYEAIGDHQAAWNIAGAWVEAISKAAEAGRRRHLDEIEQLDALIAEANRCEW